MKFSVDAVNLKTAMDRMLPLLKIRTNTIINSDYMHIIANENGVSFVCDTLRYALEIKLKAEVKETGDAWLHYSDIKRLSSLAGWVTVSTANKRLCFQCSKKRVELMDHNIDLLDGVYKTSKQDDRLFDIAASDLCSALASVDAAVDRSSEREMLQGYNINGKIGRVLACDGYRLHSAKLFTQNESMNMLDLNRTIRGEAYAHLKVILKPCMDSMISIHGMDQFMKFVGEDFEYYVAYIEGEYMNVDSVIPKRRDYDFKLNASELGAIAKEYERQCGREGVMALAARENRLYAAFMMEGYRTADSIEHFEVQFMPESDYYLTLFNPVYIRDAMAAFEKNERVIAFGGYSERNSCNVQPIMFVSDKLECLVLPVRGSQDKADAFNRLVFDFIAA